MYNCHGSSWYQPSDSFLRSSYCDEEGDIIATGSTEDVLTQEILEKVFNIDVVLSKDPKTGKPLLVTYDLCRRAYS